MTTYQRYTAAHTGTRFVITEIEPTNRDPKSWWMESPYALTYEAALTQAATQDQPVRVHHRDGITELLGDLFEPAAFEQAAYSGYVAYGLSMSDGYYAPISFDAWVHTFRSGPELTFNNCDPYVKASLATYQRHLAAQAAKSCAA
ncbi:hypothetical protein ACIBKY_51460 [Nonomuraea sp. NPDC050394]|uniref:hypothetical protein n=1 Tax=Nonomuraea sp. NPDC050394 TaxID=3364363 RepID=UPI00379453DB